MYLTSALHPRETKLEKAKGPGLESDQERETFAFEVDVFIALRCTMSLVTAVIDSNT